MTTEHSYSKEVIDLKVESIHRRFSGQDEVLAKILTQTLKTNGRVNKMEKIMIILGAVTATLLVVNGSSLLSFLMSIIK